MKTLELNQVIKVGKYECRVTGIDRYFLTYLINSRYENDLIIKQFISINELKNKFNYLGDGDFPSCETLEQLTQVVEYLKSFEKPEFKRGDRILVYNKYGLSEYERIFFEYIDGNDFPFMCVDVNDEYDYKENNRFSTAMWKFAEPIPQPKQITKDEIKKAFDCETFEIID